MALADPRAQHHPCGSPGHTCDLHRQDELVAHYTARHTVPTIVWDKDLQLERSTRTPTRGTSSSPRGHPVTIDFDDLTLAPFGYDLAKLIVTLAMTHGPIPAASIAAALTSYNKAASRHCRSLPGVTWEELMDWAEIHHILTSRYAADGRYPCRWDQARPGPAPEGASPWP